MQQVYCVFEKLERYYDDNDKNLEVIFNSFEKAEEWVQKRESPDEYVIEIHSVFP